MPNPYLLLSPIGMFLVGLLAVVWWRVRTKAGWRCFAFGGLMWVVAVAPKFVMDYTVSPPIYAWLNLYGAAVLVAAAGLYVGLRTGFFESGFSYLAVSRTKFRNMKLHEAVAFGIGFGSMEAIVLGLLGLISISVLLVNPGLVELLPPAQQAALDLPTIAAFAAILERAFTLAIHVFASLLVVYAVVKRNKRYLAYSILFKALLDGLVPLIGYGFDLSAVEGIYMAEIPVMILGLLALYGTRRLMRKF
jgi:uncharacterized membrane protein YhfC